MDFNFDTIANAYPLNGRECIKTTNTRVIAILKWTLISTQRHEHELHKCHLKMNIYQATAQTHIHSMDVNALINNQLMPS